MTARTLSPLDTLFLHLDSSRTPMHMGSIGIFDGAPLTAPDGTLRMEELRRHVEARLSLVPTLRRMASRSPLWTLAPVWQDDPAFDVRAHVRRVRVPAPGDEEQLFELCAEILSWPLAADHPLWEMWFVEGLTGGRVAVLEKLHHSLADGLGGVELALVLLDLERHPAHLERPPVPFRPHRPPSLAEVTARDLSALALGARRRVEGTAAALRHPAAALERGRRTAEGLAALVRPSMVAPRCSLNVPVGRQRRVAAVRQRLAPLATVGRWAGVPLNDVLLTAVAGGLRAVHLGRDERLHEVQVLVPVGYGHGAGGLGNNVSAMVVRLPLDEADPAACLGTVARATAAAKRRHQADGSAALISALGAGLQPGVAAVAAMVQRQPFVNVVVTNVPGPRRSLYAMGARMLDAVPIVPIAGNLSIGVAALTYHGGLTVGLFADRRAWPDLEVMATGMERTFDALVHRAQRARRVSADRPGPPVPPAGGVSRAPAAGRRPAMAGAGPAN